MDKFHIDNFGLPNTSALIKFEMYNDVDIRLTEKEKKDLNFAFCRANEGFQKQFPEMVPKSGFGYADYHQLASEMLPSRVFFKKYPILFQLGQIAILCFIGFLVLYLFIGRVHIKSGYKIVTRSLMSRNRE